MDFEKRIEFTNKVKNLISSRYKSAAAFARDINCDYTQFKRFLNYEGSINVKYHADICRLLELDIVKFTDEHNKLWVKK